MGLRIALSTQQVPGKSGWQSKNLSQNQCYYGAFNDSEVHSWVPWVKNPNVTLVKLGSVCRLLGTLHFSAFPLLEVTCIPPLPVLSAQWCSMSCVAVACTLHTPPSSFNSYRQMGGGGAVSLLMTQNLSQHFPTLFMTLNLFHYILPKSKVIWLQVLVFRTRVSLRAYSSTSTVPAWTVLLLYLIKVDSHFFYSIVPH